LNKTEIRDTAYGGYGVGKHPDGRVVFIPHTVTGDVVSYEVTDDKAHFIYGNCTEILEASELRGEIYCPHLGRCGGCVFGHIDYEKQLDIKLNFVKTAFDRSKLNYPEPEVTGSDFREFRNRATFRFRKGDIGFFRFKSNDFIPIGDCPVIKRSMVKRAKELAVSDCAQSGVLYLTENENGESLAKTDADFKDKLAFAGLKCSGGTLGKRTIPFKTDYGTFFAGFGTFLQGNRHISSFLQDFVYESSEGRKALELYCGAGFLTLPLAEKCGAVDAVENFAPSVRLGEKMNLTNVRWHISGSEHMVRRLKRDYDVLVADPPRNGMDKTVCNYIRESNISKLILISCDPNTFARDISRISDFYNIEKILVCDMFPGSYHVETLALLNRVK